MGVCGSMMIACVCMCGAEVCGGVGEVEWCECECGCVGGGSMGMCVRACGRWCWMCVVYVVWCASA